jgi:sugar lactone lactonase YvrE
MIATSQAQIAIEADAVVGEGPCWDDVTERLEWIDMAGRGFSADVETGVNEVVAEVDDVFGAMLPASDARAAAVGNAYGRIEAGRFRPIGWLDNTAAIRVNDAKCDSHGRMWIGTTGRETRPSAGSVYVWSDDGVRRSAFDGLVLPNGMGWTCDDAWMYLADSLRHVVLRARFDGDAGTVSHPYPFVEVLDGKPDGLCVGEDDSLWVAVWGAGEVRRFDHLGRHRESVRVPAANVSSCAISPHRQLFITTARHGLDAADLLDQPHAGSVFMAPIDVQGAPTHRVSVPQTSERHA